MKYRAKVRTKSQSENTGFTDGLPRKKIKKVNSDLAKLVVVLKYTSLEDLWFSIRSRAKYMDKDSKNAIIERCYDNWKHNIR